MTRTIETWTLVGGPADGRRQAMHEPRDTLLVDTTILTSLRSGLESIPTTQRRSTIAYSRHTLRMEDGDTLAFYIAEGISPTRAMQMLFERYTETKR